MFLLFFFHLKKISLKKIIYIYLCVRARVCVCVCVKGSAEKFIV